MAWGWWFDDVKVTGINIDKTSISQENIDKDKVKIYPNPVNDILNISAPENIESVKIINSIGQLIYQEKVNTNELKINTNNYKSGFYIISIKTKAQLITRKIIK